MFSVIISPVAIVYYYDLTIWLDNIKRFFSLLFTLIMDILQGIIAYDPPLEEFFPAFILMTLIITMYFLRVFFWYGKQTIFRAWLLSTEGLVFGPGVYFLVLDVRAAQLLCPDLFILFCPVSGRRTAKEVFAQ